MLSGWEWRGDAVNGGPVRYVPCAIRALLTLASAALCAAYGFINWNKPNPDEEIREIAEEEAWEKKEPQ